METKIAYNNGWGDEEISLIGYVDRMRGDITLYLQLWRLKDGTREIDEGSCSWFRTRIDNDNAKEVLEAMRDFSTNALKMLEGTPLDPRC